MNIEKANKIQINNWLKANGFNPVFQTELYSLFPSYSDSKKLIKVDNLKNTWTDLASGKEGKLIDLVCLIYNVDLTGALLVVNGFSSSIFNDKPSEKSLISFEIINDPESPIQIIRSGPIVNKDIIRYLRNHFGINSELANKYAIQVFYSITHSITGSMTEHKAVAFVNDKNGAELLGINWCGYINPKAITSINCEENIDTIDVFLKFTDMLSFLKYFEMEYPTDSIIVLNSQALRSDLYEVLPQYSIINLWLPNDRSGRALSREIKMKFPQANNKSVEIFPNHITLNNFLLSDR